MKPFLALILILPLAACAGGSANTTTAFGLEGRAWQLQYVGKTAVPEGKAITATFADGAVRGYGGCNRYSASCEVDGNNLVLGHVGATKMYCTDPVGSMEARFFRTLVKTVRWQRLDDGRLQLLRADGEALTFLPSP